MNTATSGLQLITFLQPSELLLLAVERSRSVSALPLSRDWHMITAGGLRCCLRVPRIHERLAAGQVDEPHRSVVPLQLGRRVIGQSSASQATTQSGLYNLPAAAWLSALSGMGGRADHDASALLNDYKRPPCLLRLVCSLLHQSAHTLVLRSTTTSTEYTGRRPFESASRDFFPYYGRHRTRL